MCKVVHACTLKSLSGIITRQLGPHALYGITVRVFSESDRIYYPYITHDIFNAYHVPAVCTHALNLLLIFFVLARSSFITYMYPVYVSLCCCLLHDIVLTIIIIVCILV